MPSIERLRFVSSGTEAAMSALRARPRLHRPDKVIKMAGGYHGHADGLLVEAGSGAAGIGRPDVRRRHRGRAADTLVAPYNDLPPWRRCSTSTRRGGGADRRAGGRQHGRRPARPGYLDGPARADREHGRCSSSTR
jgi:glutamate-1-semialdehyde 2,1-aminomutase